MMHILEADGILLDFGAKRILSNIYIKCETNTITGILGRNGQGKSCLLNIIYGNLKPLSKSVRIDKITLNSAFRNNEQLTFLPQFNFIPANLTLDRVFNDFLIDFYSFVDVFSEFKNLRKSTFGHLSGGQRRLVEVFVILKAKSQFSILDEPFSHLTPIQIEKIMELIQYEKSNKGFIITDHLYQNVLDISDAIYLLNNSRTMLINELDDLERFGYVRL
ncbi:ATP-binding cassette domain-containing protein [Rhizosphaericola mali]|uniref:ATP-binding cassette domain-containing protein n=1 Tax=Rhizosphaericola mali TaxID=2545455 RepID=A0A5P2G219_9BACT|nr:ATP-binding cassette domain-containing protein [Rhizosphaericola mali]QES89505.1 ATP-binding cassette domain-containing protein [Rhizosphaericola mali]